MYNKLLVPTDGSDYSKRAFEESKKIAQLTGAEVIVLHVVHNPSDYWAYNFSYGLGLNEETIEKLGQLAIEVTIGGSNNSVSISTKIRWGNPAAIILDEIKKENIDLVVIGSHGKGFVKDVLLGSISNRIVQLAPCPVLVTK